MIEQNTVFVLGAGASKPYGFPTGDELLECISSGVTLGKIEALYRGKRSYNGSRVVGEYHKLQAKVIETHPKSIDLLISRWPELEWIGKLAIITEILEAENKSLKNMATRNAEHWYTELFHKLTDQVTSRGTLVAISKNQISIVTFNYDRSLEFRLRTLLELFLDVDSKDPLVNYFNSINIFHVYGSLGNPFDPKTENYFPYGQEYGISDVEKLSAGINVMYSSRAKEIREEVSKLLFKAERTFFLGFAYHASNMEFLQFPPIRRDNIPKRDYFGTCVKVPIKTREELELKFKAGPYPNAPRNIVVFKDCNCAELVVDYL